MAARFEIMEGDCSSLRWNAKRFVEAKQHGCKLQLNLQRCLAVTTSHVEKGTQFSGLISA
jgi:hypothetical protein